MSRALLGESAEPRRRWSGARNKSRSARGASSALVFNRAFSNYPGASQPKVNLAEVNYTEC